MSTTYKWNVRTPSSDNKYTTTQMKI